MIRVLNLLGVPDNNRITVRYNNGDLHKSSFYLAGNVTLAEFLEDREIKVVNLRLGGILDSKIGIGKFDLILNSICDPDSNSKSLKMADRLVKNLRWPVINSPDVVGGLGRERIVKYLEGIEGVWVPPTLKVRPSNKKELIEMVERTMGFPVLIRQAELHGGVSRLLLSDIDEQQKLDRFAFDGRSYYITRFVDFRNWEDGYYRKYRVVFVDGKPFLRHMITSTGWNVHASSRRELMDSSIRLRKEERHRLYGDMGKLAKPLASIARSIDLDYFGVDFALDKDGMIIVFGLNTCMNAIGAGRVSGKYAYLNRRRDEIIDALKVMIFRRSDSDKRRYSRY